MNVEKIQIDDEREIVIIDDGSNDDSFKILSKSNFIKLLKIKVNGGKGAAIKEEGKNQLLGVELHYFCYYCIKAD